MLRNYPTQPVLYNYKIKFNPAPSPLPTPTLNTLNNSPLPLLQLPPTKPQLTPLTPEDLQTPETQIVP